MKLNSLIRGVGHEEELLAAHAERRLRFGLTRFGSCVERVHFTLVGRGSPEGRREYRCRVRAVLSPRGETVARAQSDDPREALARATESLAHAVARRLECFESRGLVRFPRASFEPSSQGRRWDGGRRA